MEQWINLHINEKSQIKEELLRLNDLISEGYQVKSGALNGDGVIIQLQISDNRMPTW